MSEKIDIATQTGNNPSRADWQVRLDEELHKKKASDGLKFGELAKKIGRSRDWISRIRKPGANPSAQDISDLCEKAGISFVWVWTGRHEEPVYDQVITQVSQMTKDQMQALHEHLQKTPLKREE